MIRLCFVLLVAIVTAGYVWPQTTSWESYLRQGSQFEHEGRYAEAEAAFATALQEAERLGPGDPAIPLSLVAIGSHFSLRHEYAKALATFNRSLPLTKKAFGPEHFRVGVLLADMAMLHHIQGRSSMAEELYHQAVSILEKNEHPDAAKAEASLAKLLLLQKRNTEAEALLEKAVPVLERLHQRDDVELPIALANLAESYRLDGRYPKAETLFRRALAIVEEDPGTNNEEVQRGLIHFAEMLRKMKRKTEARDLQAQLKSLRSR
jgi:tetratricopeptide (TPR) repeat protein